MLPNKFRVFLFGTLRRQLIVGVAITHAILMSLLLFDLTLRQEAMFLERQKEHAIALAQSLALSSAGWVAAHDIAGLQELVDAQKRYPELMYSILTNSEGRIFAHIDRQKVGLTLLDFPKNTQEIIYRADKNLIDIAVPVMLAGKHVGWSRVGVGQGLANQKIAEITHEGIIYAVIAILLGSLMAWIMGRKITQRLHSIQKVMLDVKAGNSQERIHLDGNDEASVLAREFNGMLDVVAQREQDLNNSKEQLEERVEERTAEIVKSVNRLREQAELLNLTTDGIFVRTMGNVITFWNKGAEQQYGWKAEEVVGKDMTHDLLKTIFPIPLNEINDILLHNNHWEGELTQTKSDGSKLIVVSRWVIQRNDANMPVAILEVNTDISVRKKAEEEKEKRAAELVISEARFKSAFDHSAIGMALVSKEGKWLMVNISLCKMLGYSEEDLLTRTFQDITHPDDLQMDLNYVSRLLAGEIEAYSIEKRYFHKQGQIIWIHLSVSLVSGGDDSPLYFISQIENITERKQTEMALRIANNELALQNEEKEKRAAYKDMSWEVLQILDEPENIQVSIQRVLTLLKTRTGFDAVGIRLQKGDDFPYFAQNGFSSDFLLKENSLLERTADSGVCRDKDGNVCLECTCGLVISEKTDPANPLFTRGGSFWINDSFPLLDIPSEEDPRRSPRNECIHDEYASIALVPIRYKDRIAGLIQFNDRRKGLFTLNLIEILEGIASNIGEALLRRQVAEEKVRLEHQFHQAQKLESLGVLAGGIAHDFNNILTVILGHCYTVREGLIPVQELKAKIMQIETAGNRAADLCRQMLTYAGKSPLVQTRVNLWLLIDEVVKMLQAAIKKNVTIELDLKRDVPEIKGDTGQIQQIIMNLIINAADAIGEANGTIRVVLTKAAFDADHTAKDLFGTFIKPGSYACLEVIDTGCGMDEATMKRIFEPFFTTKFTGRGLGMSAVLGIIKSHEGCLQLTSTPGIGSTFKVFFAIPKISDHAETISVTEPLTEKSVGSILLVEDEELLRIMGQELLKAMGFSVMTALDGSGALEIYRERSNEINVILLDLMMPVMGGVEAYHELRKINQTVPIIICSGYGVESVEDVIGNDPHAGFVHKPYNPKGLRDVMVKMMG